MYNVHDRAVTEYYYCLFKGMVIFKTRDAKSYFTFSTNILTFFLAVVQCTSLLQFRSGQPVSYSVQPDFWYRPRVPFPCSRSLSEYWWQFLSFRKICYTNSPDEIDIWYLLLISWACNGIKRVWSCFETVNGVYEMWPPPFLAPDANSIWSNMSIKNNNTFS